MDREDTSGSGNSMREQSAVADAFGIRRGSAVEDESSREDMSINGTDREGIEKG